MEVINLNYPDGLYQLKELSKELSYNVARIKSICQVLKIDVVSGGGTTYIPVAAKDIISKAVADKKAGRQLDYEVSIDDEVIPTSKVKTEAPQKASKASLVVSTEAASATSPQEFLTALAALMKQQQEQLPAPVPVVSPLQAQKDLKEAADNSFLLTSDNVANILGMKKSTVSSWKDGHKKLGYCFHKVKEGSTTLWKVQQY